jgi:putative copper export protein
MFTEAVLLLHVLLASFWVGGMLFLSIVLAPFVRRLPIKDQAFQEVGRRFSFYGTFITLSLLFLTGIGNVILIHGGNFSRTVWEKLALFLIIVVVSLIHDLWAGKKAIESNKMKAVARVLGVINLLLGVLAFYMGVRIRMGY